MKLDSKSIKKIFKPTPELTFLLVGVLIFLIIIWFLVGHISFLITSFNQAFNVNVKGENNRPTFQLEAARQALDNLKK